METKTITPLTLEDKKLIMRGFTLRYYKAFHFILLAILGISLCVVYFNYNTSERYLIVTAFFIWLFLLFNFMFLIDFLYHKYITLTKKKMIVTAYVSDKYESGAENGGTIIVVNHEKFDITWVKEMEVFEIDDLIKMHFVCSKNNKRKALFKIEKTELHSPKSD